MSSKIYLVLLALVLLHTSPAVAFGAGNIGTLNLPSIVRTASLKCHTPASISKIEGHNWRHGDIEDMLKTIAFLKGIFTIEFYSKIKILKIHSRHT